LNPKSRTCMACAEQVELRKKQESARLLFEREKDRLRKEAQELAMEAEAELQVEEEEALAALRAKRRDRLAIVEVKKAALRSRLEKTYVQQQVKLTEEHLEKEREKMSLVQKTFGFFGKKRTVRPSVSYATTHLFPLPAYFAVN
jgi:hypothetical protein